MADQKREIEYTNPPSTTSDSTKSPSSIGESDKSPSNRIPNTLNKSTSVQISFEQARAEGREFISKTHSLSKKERKALRDAWIARSKRRPIIINFGTSLTLSLVEKTYGGPLSDIFPLRDGINFEYEHGLGEFAPADDDENS